MSDAYAEIWSFLKATFLMEWGIYKDMWNIGQTHFEKFG